MHRRLLIIFVLISLAACAPKLNRADNTTVVSTPTATEFVCQPSRIQESRTTFPEIQATMHSEGEVWALLFFDEAHAKEDLKMVWRVTVTGPGAEIQAQAQKEEGIVIQPIWGPEFHESSNWDRPGTEWGTGFNFPEPGCWTLTITLGATKGEIVLNVLPSQGS